MFGATLLLALAWFLLRPAASGRVTIGQMGWAALGCLAPSVPVLVLIGLVVTEQQTEEAPAEFPPERRIP